MLLDLPGPALRLLTDVADFHFSDIPVRGRRWSSGVRTVALEEYFILPEFVGRIDQRRIAERGFPPQGNAPALVRLQERLRDFGPGPCRHGCGRDFRSSAMAATMSQRGVIRVAFAMSASWPVQPPTPDIRLIVRDGSDRPSPDVPEGRLDHIGRSRWLPPRPDGMSYLRHREFTRLIDKSNPVRVIDARRSRRCNSMSENEG